MSELFASHTPVAFLGEKLAASPQFKELFRDGMDLVEEVASYLDGDGRRDAKALPRHAALSYATETMRLTTRLMQLASWLLLQRAVNEGEITLEQAATDKAKVRLSSVGAPTPAETLAELPTALQELIERVMTLQARIVRLDGIIYGRMESEASVVPAVSPLAAQLSQLEAAFLRR